MSRGSGNKEQIVLVSSSRLGGKFPQRSEQLVKAFRNIGYDVNVVESFNPFGGAYAILGKRGVRGKLFSGFRAGLAGLMVGVFGVKWVYDFVEIKSNLCRDNWRGIKRSLIPLIDRLDASMIRSADLVFAVSEETMAYSMDKGVQPVLSRHGQEADLFDPGKYDRAAVRARYGVNFPLIIFIGKLTPMYGIFLEKAILAMGSINKTCQDAEFWVYGDGPDRFRLEGIAKEGGGKVRFKGYLEHGLVPEVVAMADVGINAYSTGSLKLREWMAMGLPVVGPSVMREEYVKRCEWDPDSIAEAVVHLIKNPSRIHVASRTWEDVVVEMAQAMRGRDLL